MSTTQEQPKIYIPKTANTLADVTAKQQIRLGLQGFGGTGKNWSVLGSPDGKQKGFPNPIVANLDRGLGAHQGIKDILEVPFYKMYKREEMKDKITDWFSTEGYRLTENQTLIVDSLSCLDQIYHFWYKANEALIAVSSRSGKVNDFAEWQEKTKWFGELHNIFKGFKCDVILLAHEAERPDKPTTVGQPGTYTGKIRPILSGQFGDTIVKEYTDWFRQHSQAKPKGEPKPETLAGFRMTAKEFQDMCNSFEGDTIYFWQTKGDDLFNAKASSLINPPTYIPATYDSFVKWTRNK